MKIAQKGSRNLYRGNAPPFYQPTTGAKITGKNEMMTCNGQPDIRVRLFHLGFPVS
jgi:hypothetical protein